MTLVDEITLKAQSLPTKDGVRLTELPRGSLQEDTCSAVEAARDTEIRRRLDEVDAGTVRLISAAEALAEVRRLLK